jgi:hypothetical protein
MIFSLLAVLLGAVTFAQDWNVTTAAEPYKGTTIKALFLDRPGYAAAIDVIPQFEEATGKFFLTKIAVNGKSWTLQTRSKTRTLAFAKHRAYSLAAN